MYHGLRTSKLPTETTVAGCSVKASDRLKILGVTLDASLTSESHMNEVMQFLHQSPTASTPVTDTWRCANTGLRTVSSRLDYCNALLFGITTESISRLHRVHNSPAGVVNSSRSPTDLHWLPVDSRMKCKVAAMCYKCYCLNTPDYLSSVLQPYISARTFRSTRQGKLAIPQSRNNTTARQFSWAAPSIWKSLPDSVREAPSLNTFKTRLKTHYYRLNFEWL